jgi:hypothetical protein
VKRPVEEIEPAVADHRTRVSEEPVTAAFICSVPPLTTSAFCGVTVTSTALRSVTTAVSVRFGSVVLVARTVTVPVCKTVAGALYRPPPVIVPSDVEVLPLNAQVTGTAAPLESLAVN